MDHNQHEEDDHMTSDATSKNQETAPPEALSYTEGRSQIRGFAQQDVQLSSAAQAAEPPACYTIWQERFPTGETPYPWQLASDGTVLNQHLWRGDPYRLVGFQRGATQRLVLHWEAFVKDPSSAVGLVPVMVSGRGGVAAWQPAVADVAVRAPKEAGR